MIFTLSILINVALIVAVWSLSRKRRTVVAPTRVLYAVDRKHCGLIEKALRRAAIADKVAERAFNLASTANLGVVALQRTLSQPRFVNKQSLTRNALAKKEVDALFGSEGFDWLYPVLDDESRDLLDKAKDHHEKFGMNNKR